MLNTLAIRIMFHTTSGGNIVHIEELIDQTTHLLIETSESGGKILLTQLLRSERTVDRNHAQESLRYLF